jgi:rare lipoprotein A (peptidoglycan hydrolase)
MSNRPDRVAMWAVLLGLSLMVMAGATARGQSYVYATLGNRALAKGASGADVKTLQGVLKRKGYSFPKISGHFGPKTKAAVKRFQRRHGLKADGKVGARTNKALAAGWRTKTATFYGPGLYGRKTACGRTLSHGLRGVAHKKLPCGTRVPIYYAGRIVILPVVDRGPYTRGVTFDITSGAARALGMSATSRIRAGY